MREQDGKVNFFKFFVRRSEKHGSGHIGAIPLIGTPEIHKHAFVLLKFCIAGLVMRNGGVFTESNDRVERSAARAVFTEIIFEFGGKLFFGYSFFYER